MPRQEKDPRLAAIEGEIHSAQRDHTKIWQQVIRLDGKMQWYSDDAIKAAEYAHLKQRAVAALKITNARLEDALRMRAELFPDTVPEVQSIAQDT